MHIGIFKIIGEVGIASGVRRIEAVTGNTALNYIEDSENRLRKISDLVKAKADNVEDKTAQMVQRNRQLEKELEVLKTKLAR